MSSYFFITDYLDRHNSLRLADEKMEALGLTEDWVY